MAGYSQQGSVGWAGQGSVGFTPGAGRGSGEAVLCGSVRAGQYGRGGQGRAGQVIIAGLRFGISGGEKREKRNGGKEKGSGLREKGAEKGALLRFTPVDPS